MEGVSERRLLVVYGSQTGTAQEVAERVGRDGKRFHFTVTVSAFDEFPLGELPLSSLVVYVVSTTGQGEEPDNMKKSWRMLLRKNLPTNSLAAQKFGVLGLGDSSYTRFNIAAKKLGRRLCQLGGTELLPIGLCDDQHDLGPDFVIDSWLQKFWDISLQLFPLPPGLQPISADILPQPKYLVHWEDQNIDYPRNVQNNCKSSERGENFCQQRPFPAPVLACSRLTPQSHFQDVRLVELDLTGSEIEYQPGDVALVQPQNLQENIEDFFSLFPSFDRHRRFTLESTDPNISLPSRSLLPQPCSILQAVTSYFDIQSIPKRYFFEVMSHFTTDELEKEKLQEFNTAEGQQELYSYCNRPRRNILEVLYDFRFTTPNIPFQTLFDLIPAIKPRSFSICSSLAADNQKLKLLVAVVNYRSSLKISRKGLCSNYLSRLGPGEDKVPIWIKRGTMKFPQNGAIPCIMVGPGTGVAPFRSYITSQLQENTDRQLVLFFGCRSQHADYFFHDEWSEETQSRAGGVSRLQVVPAFSRDQEDKVYVQHKIREQEKTIQHLVVERGGWVFVAGNSKGMPGEVKEAFIDALGLGKEAGEKWVEKMEAEGRYQTETWS